MGLREFEIGEVMFRALPKASDLYVEGRAKGQHTATARVVVTLSAETPQEATEHAEREVLPPFSLALSLAHGHHVFFYGYECYEEGVQGGEPAYWSIPLVRTGKRIDHGEILYVPPRLPSFLNAVIPRLRDPKIMEEMGLRLALLSYLEPMRTADMPLELAFITYWLALEVLARRHARKMGNPTLLAEKNFRRILQAVRAVVGEIAPAPGVRDQIFGRLGWFNELPILGQIDLLLKHHRLPAYTNEVKRCYRRRNDLLHGRYTPP